MMSYYIPNELDLGDFQNYIEAKLQYEQQCCTIASPYLPVAASHTTSTMLENTMAALSVVGCTASQQLNYWQKKEAGYSQPQGNKTSSRRGGRRNHQKKDKKSQTSVSQPKSKDKIDSLAKAKETTVATRERCIHQQEMSEVECLYSPSHWSLPNKSPSSVIQNFWRVSTMCSMACGNVEGTRGVSYGPLPQQKLDFYGDSCLPTSAPVFAFIHGGYWQDGSRQLTTFMVQSLVSQGIVVAVIGYGLAQNNSMDQMVAQIVDALLYLDSYCSTKNSDGFVVGGHSAGAHLAAMAVIKLRHPLVSLKGLVLISGIFDLQPLLNTYIHNCFTYPMTPESAKDNSPSMWVEALVQNVGKAYLVILVGDIESPIFKSNSWSFYDQIRQVYGKQGKGDGEVWGFCIPEVDHFMIVEQLQNTEFYATQLITQLCKNTRQQ